MTIVEAHPLTLADTRVPLTLADTRVPATVADLFAEVLVDCTGCGEPHHADELAEVQVDVCGDTTTVCHDCDLHRRYGR